MGIAPFAALLIAIILVKNGSFSQQPPSKRENNTSMETTPSIEAHQLNQGTQDKSPSFRMIVLTTKSRPKTAQTKRVITTTKGKTQNQAKSANIIQMTTKKSQRVMTTAKKNSNNQARAANIKQMTTKATNRLPITTKRNGQTTKPVMNQQLRKTTPKALTQTTKTKPKTLTTAPRSAQMKGSTERLIQPRVFSGLFYNGAAVRGGPTRDQELRSNVRGDPTIEQEMLRTNVEPVLIKLDPSEFTKNTSYDPSKHAPLMVPFSTTNAPEDYEDYGNSTTTELAEHYDDLTGSNTTLPSQVPETTAAAVEDITRKRLKRRKTTTIDPALTTRRRLKRKRTTPAGPELD